MPAPASPLLDMVVEHDPDGPRVVVVGELDLSTAPGLLARVRELGDQRVIVDLSGVTFLDSSGLHALVTLSFRHGARVVSTSDRVRRIVQLTGLEQLLDT